jgi:hypothetical protein
MRRKVPVSSRSAVVASPEMPALLTRMSRGGDARFVGHVEDDQPGAAADLRDGPFAACGVARAGVDGEARLSELAHDLLADALVGAGDQRDPVLHAAEDYRQP